MSDSRKKPLYVPSLDLQRKEGEACARGRVNVGRAALLEGADAGDAPCPSGGADSEHRS
jgi:hypothetical protein